MRLTCPNCGAQYEVPDQVVPLDGRDVQCSNCGSTWFQDHPDNPQPQDVSPEPEAGTWEEHDDTPEDFDDVDPEPENWDEPEEEMTPSAPPARDVSVNDLLREEAEREARLRAEEEAGGLESQPDLGLEQQPADDAQRRAAEARARMARLRGEETRPAEDTPEPELESRRGLLPDIDEINSTLKSGENAIAPAIAEPSTGRKRVRRSSGFSRGIAIALMIAVGLLLVYTNAPKISAAVPQADSALNAYVATVDNARIWLDQQMAALTPKR